METRTVKYDVAVHKANLPLSKGESIGAYTNSLRSAGGAYITKQLNLTSKSSGAYMIEAYADSAVFDVYKYDESGMGTYKYYAVKYTRKDSGEFSFSNMVEVERVTTFEPKSPMPVTKNNDKHKGLIGWTVSQKSIWSGVL